MVQRLARSFGTHTQTDRHTEIRLLYYKDWHKETTQGYVFEKALLIVNVITTDNRCEEQHICNKIMYGKNLENFLLFLDLM